MVKTIRIFDYEPPKQTRRKHSRYRVLLPKDASFCSAVKCFGKIISRHKSFYHAQTAVERLLREGKIDNTYEIIRID